MVLLQVHLVVRRGGGRVNEGRPRRPRKVAWRHGAVVGVEFLGRVVVGHDGGGGEGGEGCRRCCCSSTGRLLLS